MDKALKLEEIYIHQGMIVTIKLMSKSLSSQSPVLIS
jgi:hypothetical protein